jgi:L-fuconolactonase
MRIDAHQHFWKYAAAEYAWIDQSMNALKDDFLPARLEPLLRAARFDGSVAVQASTTVAETRFYLELARTFPFIRGVVGWVDLCAPDAHAVLADLASDSKLVGIRHVLQSEPDDFMARPDFRRGIAALAEFGLSYDLLVVPGQLPAAVALARAFPEQRFVLDHLGKPPIRAGILEPWRTSVCRLAALPNVSCKLSGLVTEADWKRWKPAHLVPYLDTVLESFGPARSMIGSDWPVCSLAGPYEQVIAAVADYVAKLSPAEQGSIFGEAATLFYRLA